jgi:hypothetical protein
MCLEPEYFEDAARRKFMRDLTGVTPDEAKATLSYYHSTIWPVATEMAEWLNENWSKRDIAIKLGDENLELIESICDC